jgi:hypothetical protein
LQKEKARRRAQDKDLRTGAGNFLSCEEEGLNILPGVHNDMFRTASVSEREWNREHG